VAQATVCFIREEGREMARFTAPMEQRLGRLEEEYGMTPRGREEETGFFGSRGFLGNIRDYYQVDSWGDWWRGFFGGGREREKPAYTVYPEWGSENIRTLQSIMRETE